MEVLFLLVVLFVVVAVAGGAIFLVAARLRGHQLDPAGDKINGESEPEPRPEHRRVSTEQNVKFVSGS